jgi:adenosine deaminase
MGVYQLIPKAELHLHIEGSMTPSLVTQLAKRNKLSIPTAIFKDEHTYQWKDFLHFLQVFDVASSVLKTPEDYRDMVYDYLMRSAKEGVIYTEMFLSPDHAALCGLSYEDHLAGAIQGIEEAKKDSGIEGRIIITCVRHFGVEKCIEVAKKTVAHPHPYVVGFGMGGDEMNFPPAQFVKAYQIAHEAGLGCTVHAGEMTGPENVWEAITHLPVSRIGHGVRSIEDANLIETLIERDITLEVCPGSNIALGVYSDFSAHPLNKLREAGVRVTLNSDDPPFFNTTIGHEYDVIAKNHFNLNDATLLNLTKNAIVASFAEPDLKVELLKRVDHASGRSL